LAEEMLTVSSQTCRTRKL